MPLKRIDAVIEILQETIRESGHPPVQLAAETRILEDTTINSLKLAVEVVKLEEATGKDPFKDGFVPFTTVGELAQLYE